MNKIFVDHRFILGDRQEPLNQRTAKTIFRELEEFSGMNIEDISKEYWQNKERIDKSMQDDIDRCQSYDMIINYYKTTSQYLYELSYWEAQKDKQREFKKLYLALKNFVARHILDYGGGIGGLAIYLTMRGIRCDYLDIPGNTFNFAKFRFSKRGLNINMLNGLNNHINSKYDAIISYDVLEHIFDIEMAINKIHSCLIKGGIFIHRSTFGHGGVHLRKHAIYQDFRKFNKLLESSGFEYIGRLKPDYISSVVQKLGLKYALLGIRISRKMKYGGNFLLHRRIS